MATNEEYRAKLQELNLVDLAKEFKELKGEVEEKEAELSDLKNSYDFIRFVLMPKVIEEAGLSSPVKIAGVGKISLSSDAYVSVVPGQKEALYEWMEEHGLGDLIKPTLNASTLKAQVISLMLSGEDYPEAFVKVTPFVRASILK